MEYVCFCGRAFASVEAIYQHATSMGHRFRCSCGELFATGSQVKNHRQNTLHEQPCNYEPLPVLKGLPGRAQVAAEKRRTALAVIPKLPVPMVSSHRMSTWVNRHAVTTTSTDTSSTSASASSASLRPAATMPSVPLVGERQTASALRLSQSIGVGFKCRHCPPDKRFKDARDLAQHQREKHPRCPICSKLFRHTYNRLRLFTAREQLEEHQRMTGHGFCAEHQVSFGYKNEYAEHLANFHLALEEAETLETGSGSIGDQQEEEGRLDKMGTVGAVKETAQGCEDDQSTDDDSVVSYGSVGDLMFFGADDDVRDAELGGISLLD